MKILIVDDSPTNLGLLRAQLEDEGYSVEEACDGLEAITALETNPPDAIISDILMPNLDGYGLCHAVRKHPQFSALPFIFYTATYVSTSDKKLGLSVGVDSYLIKPAPIDVILEALSEAMHRSGTASPIAAASDAVVFKQYNASLVKKLEERNVELQQLLENLERSQARIAEQNVNLERRVAERTADLTRSNAELREALAQVKQLSGLLPICCDCKKIRDDKHYWQSVEGYFKSHFDARFSHGYCPECMQKRLTDLQALISPKPAVSPL